MKRLFFAMLMCSMVLACGGNDPITAHAQEVEAESEATSKTTREDEWRAEFLAKVEKVDDISQIKETLIRSYQILSADQDRLGKGIVKFESKKRKGQLGLPGMRHNSRIDSMVLNLNTKIENYAGSKIYLVRRYKLILNKEQLSTSNKNQEISESEYGKKMRELDGALFRLEFLHTIEMATNDTTLALHDLESTLKHDLYLNKY